MNIQVLQDHLTRQMEKTQFVERERDMLKSSLADALSELHKCKQSPAYSPSGAIKRVEETLHKISG